MTASRAIVLDMGLWWIEYHVGANTSIATTGTYTMDSQVVRSGTLLSFSMGAFGANSSNIAHTHMAVNTSDRADLGTVVDGLVRIQVKNNHSGNNTITGWATVILRKNQ